MLEKAAQLSLPLTSVRKELRSLVVDPIALAVLAAIRAMLEVLLLFGGYRIAGQVAVRLALAAVRLALVVVAHMIADRGGQHAGRTLSVVSLVDYPNKRDQEFLP